MSTRVVPISLWTIFVAAAQTLLERRGIQLSIGTELAGAPSMIILLFSLLSIVHATVCNESTLSDPEIAGRNYRIELPGQKSLVIVASKPLKGEERNEAVRLLWNESRGIEELNARLNIFHAKVIQTVNQTKADLSFLRASLNTGRFDYVAIEAAPSELHTWVNVAGRLYTNEFTKTIGQTAEMKTKWQDLYLAIVGSPLTVYTVDRNSFRGTHLAAIDLKPPTEAPEDPVYLMDPKDGNQERSAPAKSVQVTNDQGTSEGASASSNAEDLQRVADEKANEALVSLKRNKRTLAKFNQMRTLIQPGSAFIRGKSDSEIRRAVLARFWRPAHPVVDAWLTAQLASIRGDSDAPRTASASKPVSVPAKAPVTKGGDLDKDHVYERLKTLKGNGVFFVRESEYLFVTDRIKATCDLENNL